MFKKLKNVGLWWHLPLMTALTMQRQVDIFEFDASLSTEQVSG